MENLPTPNTSLSDTENSIDIRVVDRRQKAAELAGLMRLILEAYSDEPPTRHLGELSSNPDIIEDVTGDETVESGNGDALSQPEKPAESANGGEHGADLVNPADILRDREQIMAGVREQIRTLADIHDPERLVKGYEKPFRDALRVEVCAELERLVANGGEQLDFARTRYAYRFAHLLDQLGLRDVLDLDEARATDDIEAGEAGRYESKLVDGANALHDFAELVNGDFQNDVEDMGTANGCHVNRSDEVKSVDRILEKTSGDYGGRFDHVRDAIRGRIVYAGDPILMGMRLEDAVRNSDEFVIARDKDGKEMIQNRFINRDGLPIPIRSLRKYADTRITIERGQEYDATILGEIVIATPEMAAATKIEHPLYEIVRSLKAGLATETVSQADDPRTILETRLREVSRSFYTLVAESLSERTEPESFGGVW